MVAASPVIARLDAPYGPVRRPLARWRLAAVTAAVFGIAATACSSSASAPPRSKLEVGTISGTVFIGRAKPIPVPNASITFQSQVGATRTTQASSDGAFRIRVPAENWKVVRVNPPAFDQFCTTPATIHVVASHTMTVQIQVACASSSGSFSGHPTN